MRNEERYIAKCLNGFVNQSYPKEKIEVFVMDGLSEDRSAKIVKSFQNKYHNIKLISNRKMFTASAFNLGIKMSNDKIIGIFSAHSVPNNDYIFTGVNTLLSQEADCVGGAMNAICDSIVGKAISRAINSPLGVGASVFHYSKKPQFVNTVYQGFFKREIFKKVGYFDEELIRNQDDEMSYRIRKHGGKIYFNPDIKSVCYSRSNLLSLFKQYFQYGLFKPLVFSKLRFGMQVHHFVPSIFLLYLLSLIISPLSLIYFSPLIVYFLLCIWFSIKSKTNIFSTFLTFTVYPILHISYGLGFIIGISRLFLINNKHQNFSE